MSGETACFVVFVLLLFLILIAVFAFLNDTDGGWLLAIAVALTALVCGTIFVHHEAMLECIGEIGKPKCAVCGELIEED